MILAGYVIIFKNRTVLKIIPAHRQLVKERNDCRFGTDCGNRETLSFARLEALLIVDMLLCAMRILLTDLPLSLYASARTTEILCV